MKTLQVPFCFYPDAVGGTEIYVEALARGLRELKEEVVIAAPASSERSYLHEGLPVERFAVSGTASLEELYGEGDPLAAESFARILEKHKPDLVHLHAFTRGVSLRLARQVRRRGIPIVFTYHTPTVSCQRGTLIRWGKEVCDGILRAGACTRCTLQGLSIPRPAADLIGSIPVRAGEALGAAGLSGGVWTALRMRQLIRLRHRAFRSLMDETEWVVAPCQWVRDLLIRNGIPKEKVIFCRQGIPLPFPLRDLPSRPKRSEIRAVFLGRLDPPKGARVILRALRASPELPMTLDMCHPAPGIAEEPYLSELRRLASGDPRIRFQEPIPRGDVVRRLADYDLLVVPSQLLETGPLVVLEAFGAGLPVLGSRLGGIAELVRDGVDGLLVKPDSIEEWTRSLGRVCSQPDLLGRLRLGILPPRTMDDVSRETQSLYRQALGE